jgi:hypothetical protein
MPARCEARESGLRLNAMVAAKADDSKSQVGSEDDERMKQLARRMGPLHRR